MSEKGRTVIATNTRWEIAFQKGGIFKVVKYHNKLTAALGEGSSDLFDY
jgi:hypothetical protein